MIGPPLRGRALVRRNCALGWRHSTNRVYFGSSDFGSTNDGGGGSLAALMKRPDSFLIKGRGNADGTHSSLAPRPNSTRYVSNCHVPLPTTAGDGGATTSWPTTRPVLIVLERSIQQASQQDPSSFPFVLLVPIVLQFSAVLAVPVPFSVSSSSSSRPRTKRRGGVLPSQLAVGCGAAGRVLSFF